MKYSSKLALVIGLALPFAGHAANPAENALVTSKYYVDSGLEQKANKTDVATALAGKADAADLAGLATAADIATATADMATQTWVGEQGYLTEAVDLQPIWTNITQIEEDKAASDAYFREEIRKNSELDATIRDLIVNQTDANGDGVRDGEVYVVRDRLSKLEASVDEKGDALTCSAGQIVQYNTSGDPTCANVVAGPYTGN